MIGKIFAFRANQTAKSVGQRLPTGLSGLHLVKQEVRCIFHR